MIYILLVYSVHSVQWFSPATPHWAIYYIDAIVYNLTIKSLFMYTYIHTSPMYIYIRMLSLLWMKLKQ